MFPQNRKLFSEPKENRIHILVKKGNSYETCKRKGSL